MQIHELVGAIHEAAWLPWAVQYFFLIGMSVTAFLMTLPAFVLGNQSMLPMGRLALITAVTTGIAGPVALLADLHQPARFWEFFFYTHTTSWMAWGAWIVISYVSLLLLYTWAVHRPAFHQWGQEDWRLAPLFRLLSLRGSENGFVRPVGIAAGLAAVGILIYTGAEVSVVRSRPLWHTPLLPLQFAATGTAGAIGVMLVLGRLMATGAELEKQMNRMLVLALSSVAVIGALWFALAFSGISVTHAEALASVAGFKVWQQIALWATIAIALPWFIALLAPARSGWITGLLTIHAAWMFRWTVFMGGQAVPKVGSGLYDSLMPTGIAGLMGVIGIFGFWIFLLVLYTTFIPWAEAGLPHSQKVIALSDDNAPEDQLSAPAPSPIRTN